MFRPGLGGAPSGRQPSLAVPVAISQTTKHAQQQPQRAAAASSYQQYSAEPPPSMADDGFRARVGSLPSQAFSLDDLIGNARDRTRSMREVRRHPTFLRCVALRCVALLCSAWFVRSRLAVSLTFKV